MATANITWVPFPGPNNSSQVLEYKLNTSTTWIVYNTYGPLVSSASITGLLDNKYYDFRITTNCLVGGPNPGPIQPNKIKFVCPTTTVTSLTPTTVDVDVFYGADDLTNITVNLYTTAAPTVLINSSSHNLPVGHPSGSFHVVFTGLVANTSYNIVTVINGKLSDSKNCTTSQTTLPTPICNGVTLTNLTVVPTTPCVINQYGADVIGDHTIVYEICGQTFTSKLLNGLIEFCASSIISLSPTVTPSLIGPCKPSSGSITFRTVGNSGAVINGINPPFFTLNPGNSFPVTNGNSIVGSVPGFSDDTFEILYDSPINVPIIKVIINGTTVLTTTGTVGIGQSFIQRDIPANPSQGFSYGDTIIIELTS